MSRLAFGFADKLPEVVSYLAKHDIALRLSGLPFWHGESLSRDSPRSSAA